MHQLKIAVDDDVKEAHKHGLKLEGRGVITCRDKDGKIKWEETAKNAAVNIGLNNLLDVMFHGTAATGTWYLSLIDNASYSALAPGDTMGSHAGWIENQDYDEATRPAWTEGAASGQSMTNAASVDFTMNAGVTIKGFFVTSINTIGGTTGTLWATALFDGGDRAVVGTDVIQITYTISVSSS